MKRFIIEQSHREITATSGLALIGQAIHQYTHLSRQLDTQVPLRHGIRHSDIIKSYLGLLCIGKNDFEAINTLDSTRFYQSAMGVKELPSEATLRQRLDRHAKAFLPVVKRASLDFLRNIQPSFEPLFTGHIPLDADVTPMDNTGSQKEGVSRTYKGCDGFAPMAVYLGQEGYCLELELREGRQHCQKGTPDLLAQVLREARSITPLPLLVRLDGGNDSIENIDVLLEFNLQHPQKAPVDFIIKWNPRQQDKAAWLDEAEQQGVWETPRDGKRVALFSVSHVRVWQGYEYTVRRVMRVTERTIDKRGQTLLIPEIEIEGWWTSLAHEEQEIIQLYADHGTSEQFHSEFKTDLDIERLPSGKFDTNALVLGCSVLAYNLLRWLGQNGLLGRNAPRRNQVKRRRLKTVMQELMYVAALLVRTARSLKLVFAKGCPTVKIYSTLYDKLALC
jgi:hypothetical protein